MKYPILYICLMLLMNCGNSKISAMKQENITALKQLVDSKRFVIESRQAMPQATGSLMRLQNSGILGVGNNAGTINLIGNPNYLKIKGDSVMAELPYFGEQRMGGTYGGRDQGISFNGLVKDYSAEWSAKKQRYIVRFRAEGKNDQYQVYINLFPNLNSSMSLNGNQRTPIQYQGFVEKLQKEKSKD